MLTYSGDVASDPAERLRTTHATEASGDLLLGLGHSQVSLGKVVVEGNAKVVHERQCFIGVPGESVQEVAGGRLFSSASLARFARRGVVGIGPITAPQDVLIALPIPQKSCWGQSTSTGRFASIDRGFDSTQQLDHSPRPSLPQIFLDKDKLSEVMSVAQTMQDVEVEVGLPCVVNGAPGIALKDTGCSGCFPAPFGMAKEESEERRSKRVLPQSLTTDVHPRLIHMHDRGGADGFFGCILGFFQPLICLLLEIVDRALAQRNTKEVIHRFRRTLLRQQLVAGQICCRCLDAFPVLDRRIHSLGKCSNVHLSACALQNLGLMLRNLKLWWRGQVKHLTAFTADIPSLTSMATTLTHSLDSVFHDMIRVRPLLQSMSFMPRLSSTGLLTDGPQTSRRTVHVTGRWLAAVMAVLGNLSFERRHIALKCVETLDICLDERDHSIFALSVDITDFVAGHRERHAIKLLARPSRNLVSLVKQLYARTISPQYLVIGT